MQILQFRACDMICGTLQLKLIFFVSKHFFSLNCSINYRKRSHEDDDLNDFMPLSKRINNLHIDNSNIAWNAGATTSSSSSSSSPTNSQTFDNNNSITSINNNNNNNLVGYHQHHQFHDDNSNSYNNCDGTLGVVASSTTNTTISSSTTNPGNDDDGQMHLGTYNPEMDARENPYYYNKNKLLYDLYVERMRRCVLHPY